MQKRNKIVVANAKIPVATADVNTPLAAFMLKISERVVSEVSAAAHEGCFVSSAMCPLASKPTTVPAENRLRFNASLFRVTDKLSIQFHPVGAPVPLSTAQWCSTYVGRLTL